MFRRYTVKTAKRFNKKTYTKEICRLIMTPKKKLTIYIDYDLWKKFYIKVFDETNNTRSQSMKIEELIRNYVENRF